MRITLPILCSTIALSACSYEETELRHYDFTGTVKIPVEALTLTIMDEDNNETVIENDPRTIGPVYVGVFPSIRDDLFSYPHPEMGPVLDEDLPGNTYPYGGTTVGRFDWGCYEELKCKIVTGRYESYDEILDFFSGIGQPVIDETGAEVGSDLEFRERCYEVLFLTSDDEVSFVNPNDVDFELEGDYWVADVELNHTYFKLDEDGNGPKVWGWVDMPSRTYNYASCDKDAGDQIFWYDEEYTTGTNHMDILNYPGLYIDSGDYVAEDSDDNELTATDSSFELVLGVRNDD
jgi:hypothetical protein